jgi:hypothetical protein
MAIQAVDRECPACGSPTDAGQEYCLECGHRLPVDPAAVGPPRRRLGPGGPVWTLLATGVVALVAASAVAGVRLSDGGGTPVLVATSPQPDVIPATEPEQRTEPAPATAPEPPRQRTQPTARRGNRLTRWPAATTGWTIVLASLPSGQGNGASATRQAREAARSGLPKVGVLVSSGFSSLHPGYLVVFSGVYSDRGAAERALSDARSLGYEAAYAREIVP